MPFTPVPAVVPDVAVDPAATAWVLTSTALVALVVPGLALFYAGMVGSRNVLSVLVQSLSTAAVVAVVWIVAGYSLAFGSSGPLLGDLRYLGLLGLDRPLPGPGGDAAVPVIVHAGFQMMVAVVTAVVLLGATAERWRFAAVLPFMVVWPLLVYAPVAHWVFSPEGWAARSGALDFAGGSVVHVGAGAGALALALALGRRRGWPEAGSRPHNLPFVALGAGLLWCGWFGFTAGSAGAADEVAGYAVVNTVAAAAAGLLAWIGLERVQYGKATTPGAASGLVAGLVAVTPAAGFVPPLAALVIGAGAGALCAVAVRLKTWVGYDDALDVVGVHLVGGAFGCLAVGLFATTAVDPTGADGLFASGDYGLLGIQSVTVVAVAGYSFAVTYGLAAVLDRLVGNRVPAAAERVGLDLAEHGESAYAADGTAAVPPQRGTTWTVRG